MASYFLFATYTILLSLWIYKSKWVRSSGLPGKFLLFFFLLKILAGCTYGYWYFYQQHADTWSFHTGALAEYELLFTNPWHYLTNLFHTDYPGGWRNVFSNENSDWNDLKDHLVVKFISVMHIFSFGSYYVNVVIYSFITFFGSVFLYKGLSSFYGHLTKAATFVLFLTPSCLFWTSGIHKDGLVLLLIGLVIYQLSRISVNKNAHWKGWLLIAVALAFLFLLRSYAMLAMIPAIVGLLISNSLKVSPLKSFLGVYTVGITIFFLTNLAHPVASLPQKIIDYRTDFQKMPGASRLPQTELEPGLVSFVTHIPEAMDHALLRPYVWQARSISELVAGIEVIAFLVVILLTFFFHKGVPNKSVDWFFIFYAVSVLLFIGFVVCFSGAIVRYRSIYVMMILVVSCQYLDTAKLVAITQSRHQPK